MNIIYKDGVIVDVEIRHDKLQASMTKDERLAVFGCEFPDADVWAAACAAENGKGAPAAVADALVSKGLIAQKRGDEIKAVATK